MILWSLALATTLVIGLAYAAVAGMIAAGLTRTRQWNRNALAVATFAIFASCAVGHLLHSWDVIGLGDTTGLGVGHHGRVSWTLVLADGVTACVAVWYLTLRKRYSQLLGGGRMFDDLDERHRSAEIERAGHESSRERDFLAALLTSIGEGYQYTEDDVIRDVNDQLCELTGYSRAELIDQPRPYPFWPVDEVDQMDLAGIAATSGGGHLDVTLTRKDGERFPASITIRPVPIPDRDAVGYIATFRDVTDARRREDALKADAGTDPLTGLFNRRSIDEHFLRLRAGDAVIILDLDHFKTINDTYGHATGDQILTSLAAAITYSLRGKDWAGRLGGEEFIIVVRDGEAAGARSVIDRIRQHWTTTASPGTTFSAGVAVHDLGSEPRQTLARADDAMYEAKRDGRNCTHLAGPAPGVLNR
jgi:diguanylate cyclase (GGDEF)-like protein/PAS domain S-box-containing protein